MKFEFDVDNISQISDGDHTFEELYFHRMILFSIICNTYKDRAWKSWKHADNTMFDDYFLVGISTPKGDYSYHYHKDYWSEFKVKEICNAPKWDGHLSSDINRLYSLLLRKRIMTNNRNKLYRCKTWIKNEKIRIKNCVCDDCGLSYIGDQWGLDTVLSNEQWNMICPNDDALLCANCIINRALKLDNIIGARMKLMFADDY